MDYGQFTIGRVVRQKGSSDALGKYSKEMKPLLDGRLGHIVGFDTTEYDHGISVVLSVRWCNTPEICVPIHPARVDLL